MKWLIKKLTFDWRKVPRPERSGYLSVLLVYTAMCFYGEVNGNYIGEGFSIRCLWMPWECMKQEQVKEEPPEPERAYTVTPLIYCPKCKVREHPQKCFAHVDTMTAGVIKHLPPILELPFNSCEGISETWYSVHPIHGFGANNYTISNKENWTNYDVSQAEYGRFHVEIN